MDKRLKALGVMLAVIGLAFIAGGGFAYYKTSQGTHSLQAFSAAQNVTLSYNEDGQLVDRAGIGRQLENALQLGVAAQLVGVRGEGLREGGG